MSKEESAISKAKRAAAKEFEGLDETARRGREKYGWIFRKKSKKND